jgi:hypothetical protein
MNAGDTTPPADGVWIVTGASMCCFTSKELGEQYIAAKIIERPETTVDDYGVDEWVVFDHLPTDEEE